MQAVRESAEGVRGSDRSLSPVPTALHERLLVEAGEVMGRARAAMADVADNTEALKRNWLFRGFFSERGFYNLDELTVDEYRTLLSDDRYAPLRIWLAADRLFEAGPDRVPSHCGTAPPAASRRRWASCSSTRGRARSSWRATPRPARLDRACSLHSPARSWCRATSCGTFRRAGAVGTMALGAEAAQSPSGDGRWDGVALTLFADPEQLARSAAAAAQ